MLPNQVFFFHVFLLVAIGQAANSGRFYATDRFINLEARQIIASASTSRSSAFSTDPCASGLVASSGSSTSTSSSSIGICAPSSLTSAWYSFSNSSSTANISSAGDTAPSTTSNSIGISSPIAISVNSLSLSRSAPSQSSSNNSVSGLTGLASTSAINLSLSSSAISQFNGTASGSKSSISSSATSQSFVSYSPSYPIVASPGQTPSSSASFTTSQTPQTTAALSGTSSAPFFLDITGTNTLGSAISTSVPITTTITSSPSGFETLSATNKEWSSNTVTTSDGIIFPVLVGCGSTCGTCAGCGLILEGLGGLTSDPPRPGCGGGVIGLFRSIFGCGTAFNLPGLADVSFALGIDGTPEPDGEEDSDDDDNDTTSTSKPGPSTSVPNPSNTIRSQSQSNPSPSSISASESSSSSSHSSTISNSPSNSTFRSVSNSRSISTPTSSSISNSSSISSSSSSSTAEPLTYMVYPIDGATRDQLDSIQDTLNEELGVDNSDEIPLDDTTSCFVGAMDATTAANLTNINSAILSVEVDGVGADLSDDTVVTPDCNPGNDTELKKRALWWQYPAGPELRFVSQPRDPFVQIWNTQDYVYDDTAGKGITVYVIDTGMNSDNSDISNSATASGGYRWLWPTKPFWKKGRPQTEDDQGGHGSCVISRLSGYYYGVAKLVTIVSLKHRFKEDKPEAIKSSSILENLSLVAADVKSRSLGGKAVLNLSFGGGADASYIKALTTILTDLLANDVVVVIASGNERGKPDGAEDVNRYPALLALTLTDLIVVGSVDGDGARTRFSQGGPLMDISAPGSLDGRVGVQCASGTGDNRVRMEGTSFAAPAVAGLCAYFMSLYPYLTVTGETAGRVKSYIKNLMWSRKRGPPGLWNFQQSTMIGSRPFSRKRAAVNKRQTVFDATCPNGVLSGWPTLGDGSQPPPVDWAPPGWEPANNSTSPSANATSSVASSTSIKGSASSLSSTQAGVRGIPAVSKSVNASSSSVNPLIIGSTSSLSSTQTTSIQAIVSTATSATVESLAPVATPSRAIIIYRRDVCDNNHGVQCSSTAMEYDITPGQAVDTCEGQPTYEQTYPQYEGGVTSNYAIKIGPFKPYGYPGCSYIGTNQVVGSLKCDLFGAPCSVPTATIQTCELATDTPIAYAEW